MGTSGLVTFSVHHEPSFFQVAIQARYYGVLPVSLGNLENAYIDLGELIKAIGCYQQALSINREVKDSQGHGRHLSNLGIAYRILNELHKPLAL